MAERRGRLSWAGPAAVLGALLACLAGCASIPDDGPVVSGRPAGNDRREGVIRLIPHGPTAGADPEHIVSGFLQAASGFTEDHSVARSFLATARRTTWRPDAGVLLYPRASLLRYAVKPGPGRTPATATVKLTAPVTAVIDGQGRYAAKPARHRQTLTFGLQRVGGEWRIGTLDDGLLIAGNDFGLTFSAFPIYFPDPTGAFMVPDVHWFPLTSATPAALVSALLSGPASWLQPAVTTGAPPGTRLAVPAVPILDDVAIVDLTAQARQATPRQRQLLIGQLTQTLAALRPISSVRVTVQRAAFDVGGSTGLVTGKPRDEAAPLLQAEPRVDDSALVLDGDGRLARVRGRKLVAVREAQALASPGASHPGMAVDGSAYAVLDAHRSRLRYQLSGSKSRPQVLITGADLTAPSFDPQGWVWSSPQANRGVVVAARQKPGPVTVDAPWLRGHRLVSLRISRDGTRALIAARRGARAALFVSGIARTGSGQPRSLSEPVRLLPDLVAPLDAGWVDEDQVLVLGRRPREAPAPGPAGEPAAGPQQVWVVQVGGAATAAALAPRITSISAGNGELDLVGGTASGMLHTRAGAGWVPLARGRWPAFPG